MRVIHNAVNSLVILGYITVVFCLHKIETNVLRHNSAVFNRRSFL